MRGRSQPSFTYRTSVLLALALGVAWGAPPRAATPVPQKGGNKTVFATVVDANNNAVTDVTKEDLGVREDGADRQIVDFKPATEPLDIVMMIDTTKSIAVNINELRDGLKAFAHTILAGNPGATFSIMNVASAAVMSSVDKKTPEDVDKVLAKTYPDQTEPTVFLEGMVDAGKKLMKSPSPRRVIMLINLEGVPEVSTLDPPKVIKQVVDSGAQMWVLSYSNDVSKKLIAASTKGGIGSANTGQNRDVLLNMIPPGTGGIRVMIDVPTALEDTLTKIAKALLAQYEVTYTRPDGPTPKLLQMGIARAGVKLAYAQTPPK